MGVYTKSKIDKLGNTLIYLCDNMIEERSKTHLLKLVYILDEISIQRYGIPFNDLDFNVWHLGPVSEDLYSELSGELDLLADYVTVESRNGTTIVTSKKPFSDDEFSDLEMELLEEVTKRFLYCTADELVNFTHRQNTPWYKTAIKHGILDKLESKQLKTTNIPVDLTEVIADDKQKMNIYNSYKEFVEFSNAFKK